MIAGLTVADLIRPSEKKRAYLYDVALVVGGSIVIALCAQIAIGFPVPVTGQTFAVLVVAMLLGSRRGVLCILTYLAQGLMGLPVFALGKAGLAAFFRCLQSSPCSWAIWRFTPAASHGCSA